MVDGVTGRLVPPEDPAALAEALAALIRDPALRQAMGRPGRRRILERFAFEAGIARLAARFGARRRAPRGRLMRVAFYAPMKPPDHPVPSGDRRMARAFMALLRDLGHEVELASRFRSYDRDGDADAAGAAGAAWARGWRRAVCALSAAPARPDLWFTYHLYHKAPDWLGPVVSRALRIPYVVAEASLAGKQAGGPGPRATRPAARRSRRPTWSWR